MSRHPPPLTPLIRWRLKKAISSWRCPECFLSTSSVGFSRRTLEIFKTNWNHRPFQFVSRENAGNSRRLIENEPWPLCVCEIRPEFSVFRRNLPKRTETTRRSSSFCRFPLEGGVYQRFEAPIRRNKKSAPDLARFSYSKIGDDQLSGVIRNGRIIRVRTAFE